ncbi:unnamed protein product [Vicia faba]|uniref:Uncharacterized protein n=1 Tax=Vicia faba TaxID=3906 RepID=A0AAV1ASA2_VICFA|nr:unnamed protein product [Vicia faba]
MVMLLMLKHMRAFTNGDNVAEVAVTEYPKEFNLRTAIKLERRFLKVISENFLNMDGIRGNRVHQNWNHEELQRCPYSKIGRETGCKYCLGTVYWDDTLRITGLIIMSARNLKSSAKD